MENKNSYVCKICGKEFSSLKGLGYHISYTHKISAKEYYDRYLKKENDGICQYCGKSTPFLGLRQGYQKYCCARCGGLGSSKQGKETMLQKYGKRGISNPIATSQRYQNYSDIEKQKIIEKSQKTRIKNYGSIEASYQAQAEKSARVKQHDIEQFEKTNNCTMLYTLVHKYGQGWYKAKIIKDLIRYKNMFFIKNDDIAKIETYIEENKFNQASHKEFEILQYIKTIYSGTVEQHKREILPNNLEIDIYLPDKKLGIEFNGTYWHSSLANTPKNYHFNKSLLAENVGIRLIHIYEYEWTAEKTQEKIKQYLNTLINQPVDKIYADDCIIKQVANAESQMLNEKFNLNGHIKAQITYGLYYNKNLVQLMSFNKIKHTDILNLNDSVWEIISVSSVPDKNIIGGIQKLLNYFIKHHQSKAFLLYCDFNKFDGKFWENIGMNFIGYTAPDVKWVLPGNVVVDKINHKLKNMPSRGKIYGAGYKKYIYYVY